MQDGDDDYYNAVDDDVIRPTDNRAGWPDTMPQIKLPNAWPNIYQNKSQRRQMEDGGVGGGKPSTTSSFKGASASAAAYLLWQEKNDENYKRDGGGGIDDGNLNSNADQRVATNDGYNRNKVAISPENTLQNTVYPPKSFTDISRNNHFQGAKCNPF